MNKDRGTCRRITTKTPAVFLFMLDLSGSMLEQIRFNGKLKSKSEVLSIMMNRILGEILNRSLRENGYRDYFRIAVFGYYDNNVVQLLGDKPDCEFLTPAQIDALETDTIHYEVPRLLPDGRNYVSTLSQRSWIKPRAEGSTPMLLALNEAARLIHSELGNAQSGTLPPMVFNITDGESSDGSALELLAAAQKIKTQRTEQGEVTLMNIHISSDSESESILFPTDKRAFNNNRYAELLYDMSSSMPECYNRDIAQMKGCTPDTQFRAMSFNASIFELFQMLSIGTISSTFI